MNVSLAPGQCSDQVAEDIAAFARLGVSQLVCDFRRESLAESLERMGRFGPIIRQTAPGSSPSGAPPRVPGR